MIAAGPAEADQSHRAEGRDGPLSIENVIAVVERNWVWLLTVLMIIDLLLLLDMGRGLSFFYDDWDFVTQDYGGGLHSLLAAHVGNISFFPIAIYKVLFHLVGLNHYAVYRLVLVSIHFYNAGLVFLLSSRRMSRVQALLAMALVLFLGAAWEDLLWAFQIGYLLSVAGGLTAWVLLERDDRAGDLLAMLGIVVAMGSSSIGIPVMIGIAVELAWRRQWRREWLVAIPAVIYALWYLRYGESQITANGLINAPGFVEDLAAAAFGGLAGRALEWGRPVALLAAVLVVLRLALPRPVTPRLASLLASAVSLWIVTAAARSTVSTPETSRYIYAGAVFIVLIGVELASEVAVSGRATVLAAIFVAFCAVTGLTVMHAGASGLRADSTAVTAELGALELASGFVSPGFQPDPQRAPQITAGPYLHTVHAIGSSPADTPEEIIHSDPAVRAEVDQTLVELGRGLCFLPYSPRP